MKKLLSLLLLAVLFACKIPEKSIETRGLISDKAMVVSAHPLASKVGKEVMEKGGNAIDAAIATQFALAVVYPAAGNIGGGGFMVSRMANGEVAALDYREKAPLAGSRDMYLDKSGQVIPQASTRGHLAVGVPGTVAGLEAAHKRYGKLSWAALVQPAIELADNGWELTRKEAQKLNNNRNAFIRYNTVQPDFFLAKESSQWQEGDTVSVPELAKTLERIRDRGRNGFYKGETARLIVEEMQRGKGLISLEDLEQYEAKWRTPIQGTYRDYEFISMPPPSSGGIVLAQLFHAAEAHKLHKLRFHSPEAIHLMVEAERRAYADRAEYMGDPDYYPVPQKGLITADYAVKRMESFDKFKATKSSSIRAGTPTPPESEETTHLSVVDPWGNAVSVTTTLNGRMGAKVFVGGAGFLLNNEMDDFSIKPGTPNSYGLVGGEANAIIAGKRMLSSMTPTIVSKEGRLFMVVGSPGGSTIITSVFQTIVNVIDFGMNMQEAVAAPRFHHQWLPDVIQLEENALDSATLNTLSALGHQLKAREKYGKVDAILVLPDGRLEGGADPRGDDTAAGF